MTHFTDKDDESWKVSKEARQGPDLRSNPPCPASAVRSGLSLSPAPQLGPTERLHSVVVKGTNASWPPEPESTLRYNGVALVSPLELWG